MSKHKWKILLVVLLFLCWPAIAGAASVTLAWDKSTSADVVGYRVYQSLISGSYTFGEGIAVAYTDGTSEYINKVTIDNLTPGIRYYFVVTAVNSSGAESLPSNEVSIRISADDSSPSSSLRMHYPDTTSDPEPVSLVMIQVVL